MIYGIILALITLLLISLDYAHLYVEKKRRVSFLVELCLFICVFIFWRKSIFVNLSLYQDGGLRVDVAMFIYLIRESILTRIGISENRKLLTDFVRSKALDQVIEVPTKAHN